MLTEVGTICWINVAAVFFTWTLPYSIPHSTQPLFSFRCPVVFLGLQWSPCGAHLFTRSNIHLPHKHPAVGIHESYIETPSRKLRSFEIVSYWNGWIHQYCWWKKSCTTWDVWNPINNGINYLSAGAGFQPSTVVPTNRPPFWYQDLGLWTSQRFPLRTRPRGQPGEAGGLKLPSLQMPNAWVFGRLRPRDQSRTCMRKGHMSLWSSKQSRRIAQIFLCFGLTCVWFKRILLNFIEDRRG